MRRGLTIIEVVAATVLLTLIISTCVPLFRNARIASDSGRIRVSAVKLFELEDAVDECVRQRPGLVHMVLDKPRNLPLTWTVNEHEVTADVRLDASVHAGPAEQRSSHVWIVFRIGNAEIVRWLRMPPPVSEDPS